MFLSCKCILIRYACTDEMSNTKRGPGGDHALAPFQPQAWMLIHLSTNPIIPHCIASGMAIALGVDILHLITTSEFGSQPTLHPHCNNNQFLYLYEDTIHFLYQTSVKTN